MKLLPKLPSKQRTQKQTNLYTQMLRRQAKIGGQLFGVVPDGHRREFFCLDEHTWVWHEEWIDANGQPQALTTRYDIRPHGILKSQGTNSYQLVTGDELRNLYQAARLYRDGIYTQLAA